MPQETPQTVHGVFQANLEKGMAPKDAAKDAQARTGMSLVTGARIQDKTGSKYVKKFRTTGLKYRGQFG